MNRPRPSGNGNSAGLAGSSGGSGEVVDHRNCQSSPRRGCGTCADANRTSRRPAAPSARGQVGDARPAIFAAQGQRRVHPDHRAGPGRRSFAGALVDDVALPLAPIPLRQL